MSEWKQNEGRQPVDGLTRIEVILRNETAETGKASDFFWPIDGESSDILEWREVVKEGPRLKHEVSGYCYVPVEVSTTVYAESKWDAVKVAKEQLKSNLPQLAELDDDNCEWDISAKFVREQ